ncbi:DNA repair protein RecN [Cellulomonas carbonis]|uniref:DNA repair protein RecN n=1 Tax=Cellulomonas carbonis T26 TaxID=947969 RepID=A0A0A0BV54_9CELL|nr:DNA repair protein RecN [Cellulomonas carbonis]KGM12238.1 DNA recombination protein RecN [Cellulomonas carbonis T26]GGB96628.1 DNA repair protein RecN [Cellulomonas carbonis]
MIEEIRIEDLGVIGTAHVPLSPGLTAITGETGAGKTMVLTGLGLLLGRRADAAAVRTGSTQATAEGCFVVDPASAVAERAREAGARLDDDGTLVAVRTVAAAGRSRAFLGGRSVPQAVLAEIAEELVTVHGQSDQARLRSPRHQRQALDAFAGPEHLAVLEAYRSAWAERQELRAELDDLVLHAQERAHEADLLRIGLAEVERVDPQPGEDLELAVEADRLGHVEDLRTAIVTARLALAGDDDGSTAGAVRDVDHARRALEQVAEHDPALAALVTRVAEVGYLLDELLADLGGYAQDLASDPVRLDAVQARRAELTALARAHGGTVDAVLEWARSSGLRLLDLDGTGDRTDAVRAALDAAEDRLSSLASQVSAARTDAAARLAEAVTEELGGLAMAGARLEVALTPGDALGPWGAEEVEMLLVPHAGAPARPLGQGASGGELSRVMLAIEVALATSPASGAATPPTFVFDEVDAGVGGRAAVEVGRRLAELARQCQVVVVTHLAQVAAFADSHLVVSKSRAGEVDVVTVSDVREVAGDERVAELARMLSGQEDSTAALEHAAELLERSSVGR